MYSAAIERKSIYFFPNDFNFFNEDISLKW